METMCVLRDTVDIFDRHIPKCEYPKTVSWLLLRLSGYESHWIRFWKMDGLLCSIVTRKLNRQANKNKIATRIGYSTCYTLVLFVLTPPHLPAPPPPKKIKNYWNTPAWREIDFCQNDAGDQVSGKSLPLPSLSENVFFTMCQCSINYILLCIAICVFFFSSLWLLFLLPLFIASLFIERIFSWTERCVVGTDAENLKFQTRKNALRFYRRNQ